MNSADNREEEREKLRQLDSRSRQLWRLDEEQRETEERVIVEEVVKWGEENPDDLEYLLKLAQGGGEGFRAGSFGENPLFYLVLGQIGSPQVVPLLEKALKKCLKRKMCLHSREMLQALMMIKDESAVDTVYSLVKKRKNNLTIDFLEAMGNDPNPRFLPVLEKIVANGVTYRANGILAEMSTQYDIPFLDYLNSRNKHIRRVAVDVLKLSEERMNARILEKLRELVENKKEDILTRSSAADILKKRGIEVPFRFRDIKPRNVTSNLHRLVEGMLFPEKRDRDWAMEEVVELRYQGDRVRIQIRVSLMPFAEIRIWRGCFWDVFKMGFQFSKPWLSRGKYKVIGMTRATRFETGTYDPEYLAHHLDRVLLHQVQRIVKSRGEEYMKTMNTINEAIRHGRTLLFRGHQTWEVDWDKIREQGGC